MSQGKFCDYSCEHASFPPEDMLGACRTMSGVFCAILGKVVPKHVPCKADDAAASPEAARKKEEE